MREAAARQPKPTRENPGIEVLPEVMKDLEARIQIGIKKYGEPLTTHNGRDSLLDAYQEALDLSVYLKQAILERSPGAHPEADHGNDKNKDAGFPTEALGNDCEGAASSAPTPENIVVHRPDFSSSNIVLIGAFIVLCLLILTRV